MTFDVCAWWTQRTGQTMSGKKSEFAQWLRELEETIRKQPSGCGEAVQRNSARYEARRWQAYSLGRTGGDSIEYAAFSAQYDAVSDAAMQEKP